MNEQHHTHEWVVFTTAIEDCCLMLQCVQCGAVGTVDDPTKQEWAEAFNAPSAPYRWTDDARVHLRREPPCPFFVERADNASTCNCNAPVVVILDGKEMTGNPEIFIELQKRLVKQVAAYADELGGLTPLDAVIASVRAACIVGGCKHDKNLVESILMQIYDHSEEEE